MANVNITGLPVAISADGSEYIPIQRVGQTAQRLSVGLLIDQTTNVQTANAVFAGPTSGAPAAPAFRAVVAADIIAALATLPTNTPIAWTDSGANAEGVLRSKGTGGVSFQNASGQTYFRAAPANSSAMVNYLQATGNATGNSPYLQALGSDTNVGMLLLTQGTGLYQFYRNGGSTELFRIGLGLYAPTLADEGAGTGNFTGLYINNVALRQTLTNPTYYFAPAPLGNDSNNGTSALTPKLTLQTWWQTLYDSYAIVGNLKFQLLAGTYDQELQMTGSIPGVAGPGSFVIQGTLNDHDAVIIQPSVTVNARYCISGTNGTYCTVQSMTLDGSLSSAVNGSDKLVIGQYSSIYASNVRFKGYASGTGANDISHFLLSTFTITGDLYFTNGHRQVGIYSSDSSSLYLNVNNAQSSLVNYPAVTGTVTNGSATISSVSANMTATYFPGQLVRGNGIPQNTRIGTITSNAITMVDVYGTAVPATAGGGPGTALTVGGLFFNFSSTPTFDVSMIFETEAATLNLQGIETSNGSFAPATPGSFTGQSYVVKNGSQMDFGVSALTVLPGTIAGYVDGATGAAVINDNSGSSLVMPRLASGIISGTSALGVIQFKQWTAGPAVSANANGIVRTTGTGQMFFQNEGGETYFNAAPAAASGIATYLQSVGHTMGVDPYLQSVGETNTGMRLSTSGNGPFRFYSAAVSNLLATLSTTALTLGTGIGFVASGVTYPTSAISGGIPYFSSTTVMASSALLAANAIVVGGGAGTAPLTQPTTPPTVSSTGILAVPNATDASAIGTASAVFTGGISVAKQIRLSSTLTSTTGLIVADNGSSATNMSLRSRSTGNVTFQNDSAETYFQIAPIAGSGITTYMQWVGNTGSASPYAAAQKPSDGAANVGMTFIAQNAGTVLFQTSAAGALILYAGASISTVTSAGLATTGSTTSTANIWSGGVSSALTGLTGASDGFRASAANVTQVAAENTTASSPTQGGMVGMYSNDGAAMASGDRLGGIRMGGSSSASALRNSAGVFAFAAETWVDASAYGSRLEFQNTTNGATTLSTKAILSNAGIFALGATLANTVPALKPSSTTMQARLGDDSAFAPLQGKLTTDTNATTGLVAGALAALTTASIVIYDATGTAYRVPCVTP